MERKVAECQQEGTTQDGRSRAAMINEHANGNSQGILAEVAGEADEVALGGGELQPFGELRSPSRVDILFEAEKSVR